MPWNKPLAYDLPLKDGRTLRTLHDARDVFASGSVRWRHSLAALGACHLGQLERPIFVSGARELQRQACRVAQLFGNP
jgi:hypothetical protein